MKELSTHELRNLINEGKTVNIIDVRETDELKNGKIKGAINIPLGLIEFRKQDLDKSKEYVIVCQSGGRSSKAVQFLESHGFNVLNLSGGMLDWENNSGL